MKACIAREEHQQAPVDAIKLHAGLAHSGSVHDRRQLLNVADEHIIQQQHIGGGQLREQLILLQATVALLMQLCQHPAMAPSKLVTFAWHVVLHELCLRMHGRCKERTNEAWKKQPD